MSSPKKQSIASLAATPDQKGYAAVVVDQLELFRLGVVRVLESCDVDLAAASHRAGEGLQAIREGVARLFIVGKQSDLKPQHVLKEAKKQKIPPKVLMFVEMAESADVARLVSYGVDALLLRSASSMDLRHAVLSIIDGERVIAPALTAGALGRVGPTAGLEVDVAAELSGLTRKELEVLAELAGGLSYEQIAASMIVTKATVKTHLVHIYAKLGVRNRQEAVARALALGVLS